MANSFDSANKKKSPPALVEELHHRLVEALSRVYETLGLSSLNELANRLLEAMPPVVQHKPPSHCNLWSEQDVVLITYGNSIENHCDSPLEVLHHFFKNHLEGIVNTVHILPFYPFTSDDGFSVVDYVQVNPQLGQWKHVNALAEDVHIMFDAVINHISSASRWFQEYLTRQDESDLYFTEADIHEDASDVIRPRTSPLLRRVDTVRGERYVWCTFSHDQVDLNYANPNVLIEVVKVLQFYLDQGALWFRLDAVAFLWKKIGTSCIHLPQTHEIIKILRMLLEHANPKAVVVTETNVPLHENLSYFGNANEAHVIYNFSLPPLLVYTLLSQNALPMKNWLLSLPNLQSGTAYLNFIASHDGIGLRPAEGLLSDGQIEKMKTHIKDRGGRTTDRVLADGSVKTYEMNISLFDALGGTFEGEDDYQIERFMLAYVVAFGLAGIPAIYIHSLLATPNDYNRYNSTGVNRAINRHVWEEIVLNERLADSNSDQSKVLKRMKAVLKIRRAQPAFHPNAVQHILQLPSHLLGFLRQDPISGQKIFCIHNMSARSHTVTSEELNLDSPECWTNLMTGECIFGFGKQFELAPYQALWLTDLPLGSRPDLNDVL